MAASSSTQSKSWWRSKSFNPPPITRANSSQSSLGSDAKQHAQNGPPKAKESKFNTFVATAIGKKSKKPNLTIQDPPKSYMPPSPSSISSFSSPGNLHSPVPSPYFTNRPPAKSVSTERSYEFDQRSDPYTTSEPRTPSDHPRRTSYQNSVMMFHETDPFAAGGVVMSGAGPDANRLSVWSDNSLLDPNTKRGESSIANRMSYASSSSNSHGNPADAQPLPQLPVARQRSNAASIRSKRMRREMSLVAEGSQAAELLAAAQITVENGRVRTISKSSPASPVARPGESGTFGRPAMPLRPAVQTFGLPTSPASETPATARSDESRYSERPLLHRQRSESHIRNQSKSTSSTASPIIFNNMRSSVSTVSSGGHLPGGGIRPLVLVRKASQNLPPITSAPPTSRLPPPPMSPFLLSDESAEDDDIDSLSYISEREPRSSSTSSMTFASIELDLEDFDNDISGLAREMILDDDMPFTPRSMTIEPPPRRVTKSKPSSPSASSPHLSSPHHNVLRKAASQTSMHKRVSQASVTSASSLLSDEAVSPVLSTALPPPIGKAPRKQRSFHHPRIPLPPLPSLRGSNHCPTNASSSDVSSTKVVASNTQSPPMRRRLFSGSSGRRTSISKSSSTPPSTADDDLRSLSSLSIDGVESISKDIGMRSKPVMLSFSNMGNQLSLVTENACVSPAWEEMSSTPANSKRVSHGEHIVQQHIMSPAEMLKLEQQFNNGEWEQDDREDTQSELTSERGGEGRTPKLDIEPGDFGMAFIGGGRAKSMRSRTDSLLSNMSAFGPEERTGNGSSGADDLGLRGLVGVAQTFGTPTKRPATAEATRNAGWGMSPGRSTTYSPPSTRPSTAQPSFASPPVSPVTATSVSEMTSGGLPPPPRPRLQRERQADATANRTSAVPYQALSPPPRRRPTLQSIASRDGDGVGSSSIRSSRPPSAFGQKAFNRRSLAKKPSFLEIEDEWDVANDAVSLAEMSVNSYATTAYHTAIDHEQESSFLDLDRGTSFDTIRSFDEDGRGF